MRLFTAIFLLAALLAGCTQVTYLRNAKTGETATCGGEMWMPMKSAANDDHCLKFFHQQGFDPVAAPPNAAKPSS